MMRTFIENDIYRVMLGCESRERLLAGLDEFSRQPVGEIRSLRRDDGSLVHVAVQFLDGACLERLALHGELLLMQIDNISARLRAEPSLPGCGGRSAGYAQRQFGYAA